MSLAGWNRIVWLALGLVGALLPAAHSQASVTFTASGPGSGDGPLAATIMFTAVNGGIDITITNTESGTIKKGQGISVLSFTISGLSTPTAFTELTGVQINSTAIGSGGSWILSDGTAFDDTSNAPPVNAIDHWGFKTTGSSVLLATAGSPVPGAGNPHNMILPSSGTAGPGSSLDNGNFDPYIIGPADFFLTIAGITSSTDLTSSNFTDVMVGFGTGPDDTLTGSSGPGGPGGPNDAPEPTSLIVWSLLAGTVGLAALRSRQLAI